MEKMNSSGHYGSTSPKIWFLWDSVPTCGMNLLGGSNSDVDTAALDRSDPR